MGTLHTIRSQLAAVGFKPSLLSDSAIRQLPALLDNSEVIERAVTGRYEGGVAVLVATNRRMLFIDKKLMSFRAEDFPYFHIAEIEFRASPFVGHLLVHCRSSDIHIRSVQQRKLREFAIHLENRLNTLRQTYESWQQGSFMPQAQYDQTHHQAYPQQSSQQPLAPTHAVQQMQQQPMQPNPYANPAVPSAWTQPAAPTTPRSL